jgi:peptide deformylase
MLSGKLLFVTKKKGGRYTQPKVRPEKIRLLGDPVLRAENATVEVFDSSVADLAQKLSGALTAANGAAVAAPQIGVNLQAFVWAEGEIVINPRIVHQSEELWTYREGCLSLPNMWWDLERPRYIDVEYYDAKGDLHRVPQMEDFQARVFEHEIDHLNGVLLVDRLDGTVLEDALRRLKLKGLAE